MEILAIFYGGDNADASIWPQSQYRFPHYLLGDFTSSRDEFF